MIIDVGIAPVKPAEFVIFQISQWQGAQEQVKYKERTMSDLITTFKIALEIDNVNIGYFKKCSGIESETEIIEFKQATKSGQLESENILVR